MLRIRLIFASVLALCLVLLTVSVASRASAPNATESFAPSAPPPEPVAFISSESHTIESGETFGVIMQRYGISGVSNILEAAEPFFNLARIREGKKLEINYFEPDHQAYSFSYPIDEDRTLRVQLTGGVPTASMDEVQYSTALTSRAFQVNNTLWEAATAEGLRSGDIARLARIFQWDVDFTRELRQGAKFTLVADQLELRGEPVRLSDIHAVRLENNGRTYTAIRHTLTNGDENWYAPDGTASKRPFLRSPLEYSRVTSSFNPNRRHPILDRNRPHNGTDYGAPTGTPVRAVGDGVINYSGRKGGYGNYVSINHAGPYETHYAHLNSINVRNGQRIRQGDIIGTVGSTGLATGPHLHFEFMVNGRYVNSVTVDIPTSEPLPRSERAAFDITRDQWLPYLEEASTPSLAEASND